MLALQIQDSGVKYEEARRSGGRKEGGIADSRTRERTDVLDQRVGNRNVDVALSR